VRVVIDAHGAELAEEILAQQSVEVHVKHLLKLGQVHDGDLLSGPHILAELDIGRTPQGISGEAGAPLAAGHALEVEASVTINFCAHDGSVGAGIQHEYGNVTVHFALDDNQGLHSTEGNSYRAGMRRVGHWRQQEQQQSQRSRKRQETLGAPSNTPTYPAAGIQNGAAAGSSRIERAMVKCVQIRLSENGWTHTTEDQQFSWHDATVGQRRKAIYPVAALELSKAPS
jgi:hypothetical protein